MFSTTLLIIIIPYVIVAASNLSLPYQYRSCEIRRISRALIYRGETLKQLIHAYLPFV